VSERSYQVDHSGGQWSKAKCCATFNPLEAHHDVEITMTNRETLEEFETAVAAP
jgi:hypothetical protein